MSSIIPDLLELAALREKYMTAGEGFGAMEIAGSALDEKASAIIVSNPGLKSIVLDAILGAKQRRQMKDKAIASGAKRRKNALTLRIQLAIGCIKLRRDPVYDDFGDSRLMELVGSRYGNIGRSAAIEGIRSVITHPLVQVEIRKSGEQRNPNNRRSIFDGSKELNVDDRE